MTSRPATTVHVAGAFAALAMCLLALPQGASADGLHGSFDDGSVERCNTGSDLGRGPLVSRTEQSRTISGCMNTSTGEYVSFDVCLEAAGAPVSVVPSLVRKIRASQTSRALLRIPEDDESEPFVELETNPPRSVPIADVPLAPHRANPNASCTIDRPENCRSLPPGPPHLNLEARPVPPTVRATDLDTPERPDRNENHLRTGSSVELADGYDTPPDKPPRVRSRSG